MTGLEQALVIAALVWLAVLTIVVLLVVRQIGLMTVRLSFAAPDVRPEDVGLPVGSSIPNEVKALVGIGNGRSARTLIFFSATCGDCRSLGERMNEAELGDEALVIVAGDPGRADAVGDVLPEQVQRVFEPEASKIGRALGVDSVPFGLRVAHGAVQAKAYLRNPDDIVQLTEANGSRGRVVSLTTTGE